jgi:hypothetical protein
VHNYSSPPWVGVLFPWSLLWKKLKVALIFIPCEAHHWWEHSKLRLVLSSCLSHLYFCDAVTPGSLPHILNIKIFSQMLILLGLLVTWYWTRFFSIYLYMQGSSKCSTRLLVWGIPHMHGAPWCDVRHKVWDQFDHPLRRTLQPYLVYEMKLIFSIEPSFK